MMNDDKFGMKNLDGISPVVIAVLGKDCDITSPLRFSSIKLPVLWWRSRCFPKVKR